MTQTSHESHVRRMRNRVYGREISYNEWDKCKHNWLKPGEVRWLEGQITKRYEK